MERGLLQIDRIRAVLNTARIGRRVVYLRSTSSTIDECWRSIGEGDADGLVVLAEHQTAGRGRFGRSWHSPRGASLLGSVALVDHPGALVGNELALLAAVAVRDAVASCTGILPVIKWPNDLLVRGRKFAGILVESRQYTETATAYVIGIGINCLQQRGHLPDELAGIATSLEIEAHVAIDRTGLALSVVTELDRWLADPTGWSNDDLRREWLARAEPLGGRIFLEHRGRTFSGSVLDLDPTAALVVQLDEGGVRAFNAADTTILPDSAGTGS